MTKSRLRMFAGPNGSGKTSLLASLHRDYAFSLGYNLNPDDLDRTLAQTGRMSFADWGVSAEPAALLAFCNAHPLGRHLAVDRLRVEPDGLSVTGAGPTGYLAAVLCDFLRRRWVAAGQSFTFETVMSSGDKVDLLEQARLAGFRTYMYFVCTSDAAVNERRVAARVRRGGHDVPADKIVARYARSLALLPRAVAASSRAYLFDNSGQAHRPVAEYEDGRLVAADTMLPAWYAKTFAL